MGEFERHGLQQSRLIFTDRCPKSEYMRRQGVGDIFLDTPIYNAYTTGADCLWSGCPIVTLPLERMASRAAASLVCAMGFGDQLVCNTPQEYEELAVELGTNHGRRLALRKRIEDARLTCPLYDTALWTRGFEQMLMHMWSHHAAGEDPKTFKVKDCPGLPWLEAEVSKLSLETSQPQLTQISACSPSSVQALHASRSMVSSATRPLWGPSRSVLSQAAAQPLALHQHMLQQGKPPPLVTQPMLGHYMQPVRVPMVRT